MPVYKNASLCYDGGTKNKEVPKMKMDNEKILRKQREKKAAIILAARRKEKAAARYAETRIDDTPKKIHKNVSNVHDKHADVC